MKFINYLKGISGVQVYPMVSLIFFFAFFVGLAIWIMKADKTFIKTMEEMPLNEN